MGILATTTISGTGSSASSGAGATQLTAAQWILTLGDSKTALSGVPAMGQWQGALQASLAAARGGSWTCINRGVGSKTVANYLSDILIGQGWNRPMPPADSPPAAVLINLGVNDSLDPLLSQATWTANYLAIIDFVRGSWPTAPIYTMRWWARLGTPGLGALENDVWMPPMIAQRANVFVGPDERIWLEGGDDGTTNTYDGTHQSVLGHLANAAAWKALIWP